MIDSIPIEKLLIKPIFENKIVIKKEEIEKAKFVALGDKVSFDNIDTEIYVLSRSDIEKNKELKKYLESKKKEFEKREKHLSLLKKINLSEDELKYLVQNK